MFIPFQFSKLELSYSYHNKVKDNDKDLQISNKTKTINVFEKWSQLTTYQL